MIWIVLANRKQEDYPLAANAKPAKLLAGYFSAYRWPGFVAAELKTNAFAVRYFLALVPGVAVAFACWTWRHFHNIPPRLAGEYFCCLPHGE